MAVFRIALGACALLNLIRWMVQARDYLLPIAVLPPTNNLLSHLSLFAVSNHPAFVYGILLIGCFAAVALMANIRKNLATAILLVILISLNRTAWPVTYVDDNLIVIFLFWMFLLPAKETIPLFKIFVLLLWLIPGLHKLTSPFWREGHALYVALKMPIAYFPDAITPSLYPFLKIGNYFSLIAELVVPFFLFASNRTIRRIAAGLLIAFHLGILTTMRIPFANILMISTLPMFFIDDRTQYKDLFSRWHWKQSAAAALIFAVLICHAPLGSYLSKRIRTAVAAVGIVPSLRLFNWVDRRNVSMQNHLLDVGSNASVAVDPSAFFIPGIRGTLLLSYLTNLHGWKHFDGRDAFHDELIRRLKDRACRKMNGGGLYAASSVMTTIAPPVAVMPDKSEVKEWVRFKCNELVL